MNFLASLFRSNIPVPDELKNTFTHLYADVAWFGLLSGSTIAFLSVYAARLGASTNQLGMLTAIPAVVNLIFALPAGRWLETHGSRKPVFWSSLIFRLFYLAMVPLPRLFADSTQVWAILLITFIMNIPGTALAIGFNALFGDTVPAEWRGYVAGVRNAVLSLTTIVSSIVCGELLYRLEFPSGYQVVFFLGFLGAMLSSYNLWFVKPGNGQDKFSSHDLLSENATGYAKKPDANPQQNGALRKLNWARSIEIMRLDVLKGNYRKILALLVLFHTAQFLSIPLFSLYMVDELKFTDQVIGLGTAMFNVTVFLGSMQLARLTVSMGNQKITGIGVVLLGLYPILLAFSKGAGYFLVTSLIGGAAWALVGGALYNYLLEHVPENDRPAHLAWYNLGLNAAILVGSLGGTALAAQIGLPTALIAFGILRAIAGIAILRWG